MNDIIEIAVSCGSLRGVTDINSIKWKPIQLTDTYKENAITYNKDTHLYDTGSVYTKIVADLSRICEEEDSEIDWVDVKYIGSNEKKKLFDIEQLMTCFELTKALSSGVDVLISKYYMIAKKENLINEEVMGMEVKIKKQSECCVVEVKKRGLLIDRHSPIEMRVGDVLVFYFTKD